MKRRGALREIETMFQSGKRTANHRFFATNWKKIEENDLALIDIGCVYKGYGSDICRTWCIGKPTEFQKKVTDDLMRTREKLVKSMKPGAALQQIRDQARNDLKNNGYIVDSSYLPNNEVGWGYVAVHGIGLGPMHDPPLVYDEDIILGNNMTISMTLGVRFADSTIRFEDDAVIVPTGVELINKHIPWQL